jgi:excinuclease ABC subunit C
MNQDQFIKKIKKFPGSPGVYIMRDSQHHPLYIGKASSLKHRVLSYFQRPQETRLEQMLEKVTYIDIAKTDSVIEALFLENRLIKNNQPKYNIKLKDDKTFLGIFITKEEWPRIIPARLTQKLPPGEFYGPFPSATQVREALKIIRKIFPYRTTCIPLSGKACLDFHLGMCPGVCIGQITKQDYQKTIKQIKMFLRGQKKEIIKEIKRSMNEAAKNFEFEQAAKLRDRLNALQHIQDVSLIQKDDLRLGQNIPHRIEAYDVSNISGVFSVGSMVVFTEGLIDKNQYRKFKIKTVVGADDIASLKEILARRLNHDEWTLPDLILIDGGKGQVNGAKKVLKSRNLKIPVVGIAKGPKRDKNEIIANPSIILGQNRIDKKLLLRLREEAHRFAIQYYRKIHHQSLKIKKSQSVGSLNDAKLP